MVPNRTLVTVSDSVKEALKNDEPVVALESTIVTHGMPFPQNLSMAKRVEDIVRQEGAVPATVAVIDGQPHVGLTSDQLEYLATSKATVKVSRRDLAPAVANGASGGTTVSGTMALAAGVPGVNVFVTGGIGGVHRGAEVTMDVSADLTELSRTPMAVVSAGIKSLLDIERTLECLETLGVCVAAYGASKAMPNFYSGRSPFEAPNSVSNPLEAAKLIKANLDLGLKSGILIAVPIPDAAAADGIEEAIQEALRQCDAQGVKGKAITPFVLEKINQISAGKSLAANLALIENNAKIGAQIAKELADLTFCQKKKSV